MKYGIIKYLCWDFFEVNIMNKEQQGFLIKKKQKYYIDSRKTSSILLNQLKVDLLNENREFFGGYLLDAGCGEKPYSLIYCDLVDSSLGCDVEVCKHDQRYVDVFASLDNLPFEGELFDTILCTDVLEHVAESQLAFTELERCLKRGGYLILFVPFLYPAHETPFDFYRYTLWGLRYQLEKNDLKIIKSIALGGPFFLLVVYFNLCITYIIKIPPLRTISCFLQNIFYKFYKRISFKKLYKSKVTDIISCGYFIIAQKGD